MRQLKALCRLRQRAGDEPVELCGTFIAIIDRRLAKPIFERWWDEHGCRGDIMIVKEYRGATAAAGERCLCRWRIR